MPSFEPVPILQVQSDDFVPEAFGRANPGFESDAAAGSGAAASNTVEAEPEAVVDIEAIRQEGYESGLAAGRAELPMEDLEALRRITGVLAETGTALGALRRSYLVAHRRAIVDLALVIARKLVGREIASDPDALAGIVERALDLFEEPMATVVRLSPADHAAVESGGAAAFESLRSVCDLEFIADPALEPGDVRVRAGAVAVDARLADVLARVREQLCELLDVEESPE